MDETEEQQKKEREKAEIRNQIETQNTEINNLKKSKIAYEIMKTKVNEALSKMESAKKSVVNSNEQLKNAYSSQEADKQNKKLQEITQEIDTIVGKLNNPILSEINKKISATNQEISSKQNIVSSLRNELNSI